MSGVFTYSFLANTAITGVLLPVHDAKRIIAIVAFADLGVGWIIGVADLGESRTDKNS